MKSAVRKSPRKTRRRLFWTGGVVFVVGLVAYSLFATDMLAPAASTGGRAPDIILNTAAGEFRLSEQKGRVVVLYFSFPG